MKPEPLKDKLYFVVDGDIHSFKEIRNTIVPTTNIARTEDILSAVEWLKIELCIDHPTYCKDKDNMCDNCKDIDKAFQDVVIKK